MGPQSLVGIPHIANIVHVLSQTKVTDLHIALAVQPACMHRCVFESLYVDQSTHSHMQFHAAKSLCTNFWWARHPFSNLQTHPQQQPLNRQYLSTAMRQCMTVFYYGLLKSPPTHTAESWKLPSTLNGCV